MNNDLKNIVLSDLNTGFILIDKAYTIEHFSDSIKNWFGSSIKEGIPLPHGLRASDLFSIVRYEGSEYICINSNIQLKNSSIYQLLILFKTKFFIKHFPQEVLYHVCYDEIKSTIDCITDGIYITDGEGNTLMLNKAAEKAWSLSVKELIGKNMKDLYRKLYKDLSDEEIEKNSVCLRVIKHKKEISMIQSGRKDQFKILVTGTPYFEDGRISKVISTERNLTELIELRKQLEQKTEIASKYEAELEYYRSLYFKENDIIVKDKKMETILQLAYKIAKQDTTILLQGESGVGKEVFARFIHNNSPRRNKPFIDINCAAIPDNLLESELFGYEKGAFTGANASGKVGLFELADHGTLFLDEISELPVHLQSKILRVVQERKLLKIGGSNTIPLDVRIISATNIDLKEAVDKKLFREDLYYRLNVVKISIPPLRERKEDIQALVTHFLGLYNKKINTDIKLSTDALSLLYSYSWPGNIRELSNVIEAALATCDSDKITSSQLIDIFPEMKISEGFLPTDKKLSLKTEVELYEKQLLLSKLPLFNSAQLLADSLGIDKSTLLRKMHRYDIKNIYTSKY